MKNGRLDSAETIFFERELTKVKSKSFDIKYPKLKLASGLLVPISTDAGEGAENIAYQQFDQFGISKIISNYADDLPVADVNGKEFISKVKEHGAAYIYSNREIKAARFAGKPLIQKKANAARRAIMEKNDSIGFGGDTEHGINGWLSDPNIPTTVVPDPGAGTEWVFKTSDEILTDMFALQQSIPDLTSETEEPDTMVMPIAQYLLITSKRIPDTGISVLKYFLENNGMITDVIPYFKMKGAGAGSTDAMIAYRRDPDALSFEMPVIFESDAPQAINLAQKVNNTSRNGGVLWYYPLSASIASGI